MGIGESVFKIAAKGCYKWRGEFMDDPKTEEREKERERNTTAKMFKIKYIVIVKLEK